MCVRMIWKMVAKNGRRQRSHDLGSQCQASCHSCFPKHFHRNRKLCQPIRFARNKLYRALDNHRRYSKPRKRHICLGHRCTHEQSCLSNLSVCDAECIMVLKALTSTFNRSKRWELKICASRQMCPFEKNSFVQPNRKCINWSLLAFLVTYNVSLFHFVLFLMSSHGCRSQHYAAFNVTCIAHTARYASMRGSIYSSCICNKFALDECFSTCRPRRRRSTDHHHHHWRASPQNSHDVVSLNRHRLKF